MQDQAIMSFRSRLFFAAPLHVRSVLEDRTLVPPEEFGTVKPGDWDRRRIPLRKNKKFRLIMGHLESGGDFLEPQEMFRFYRKRSRNEINLKMRYGMLREIYADIRKMGYLKLQAEVRPGLAPGDENGGIVLHLDREGELVFSKHSFHRLAISQFLALPVIPFCIGAVHAECMQNGTHDQFLRRSAEMERRYWECRAKRPA